MLFWLAVVGFLILLSFGVAAWSLAPWVPMWAKDLPRVFALAKLQSGEVFYDLGCGNGKTVLYAAEQYQCQAWGIELAWPLFIVCKLRQWWRHNPRVHFYYGDLFKTDLSVADVVYVFGMPNRLQARLVGKLKAELKPGSRVVSYTFPLHGLEPATIDKPAAKDLSIYLYQF